MTLLHVLSVWIAYESFRMTLIYVARSEVSRIANVRNSCRRCKWRLFCARIGSRINSAVRRKFPRYSGLALILGIAAGNFDVALIVLKEMIKERKNENDRGKKNNLS